MKEGQTVDDFLILHDSKAKLQEYLQKIQYFLKNFELELHPNKCSISPMRRGVSVLGFRLFFHHRLLRQRNIRKIKAKLNGLICACKMGIIDPYEPYELLSGWNAYAIHGNTYRIRQELEVYLANNMRDLF